MTIAFWQSFVLIALAEMGDKSQLVALAFATRFRVGVVLAGVFVATLLANLVSVAVGQSLGALLPDHIVGIGAGVIFIAFGLWMLKGEGEGHESPAAWGRWGAFATVTVTFFVAELGDKTMLAVLALSAREESFVGVWLGATLGMFASSALAIFLGMVLGRRLPERPVRWVAAAAFLLAGVITIGLAVST